MEKLIIIAIVLIAVVLLICYLLKAFCGESGSSCCNECGGNNSCKDKKAKFNP